MGYYECSFSVSQDQREAVIAFCIRLGCLGMAERDDSLSAYFSDSIGIATIRTETTHFMRDLAACGLSPMPDWQYVYLSERDWNETWKKRFIPICIGQRLSVLPPWEDPSAGRIPVIIDPGMAFGTGHHETTRACLELIEKRAPASLPERLMRERDTHLRMLDVGTGTGILAIAAARLGYAQVVGVDNDPLAVDAALRNVALNNVADAVTIREGTIGDIGGIFEVIAANLMSEILIGISRDLAKRLAPSGILIASGMIAGQEKEVITAMGLAGLSPGATIREGRWVTMEFMSS